MIFLPGSSAAWERCMNRSQQFTVRCPSGLRSTPGKCVSVNSVSRVRIPLSPFPPQPPLVWEIQQVLSWVTRPAAPSPAIDSHMPSVHSCTNPQQSHGTAGALARHMGITHALQRAEIPHCIPTLRSTPRLQYSIASPA